MRIYLFIYLCMYLFMYETINTNSELCVDKDTLYLWQALRKSSIDPLVGTRHVKSTTCHMTDFLLNIFLIYTCKCKNFWSLSRPLRQTTQEEIDHNRYVCT